LPIADRRIGEWRLAIDGLLIVDWESAIAILSIDNRHSATVDRQSTIATRQLATSPQS